MGLDVGAGGDVTQMVSREAGLLSQVRLLAKPNESTGMTIATHARGFNANRRCDGYAFTQQFYAANQPETTQLWGGEIFAGGPDSLSIGAAKPQEVFCMGTRIGLRYRKSPSDWM